MMDFYRAASEWAMYNWENFRVFYIMLTIGGALGGMLIWEFIRTMITKDY